MRGRIFHLRNFFTIAVLRQDLESLWAEHNIATDGTTFVEAEYLEVSAIRQ